MKRYQSIDGDLYVDPDGMYVLHSDHEADLAAAQAEVERLRLEHKRLLRQRETALKEAAALRADAERYRWLRDNTHLRDRGYGPVGQWLEIAEGTPWVHDPEDQMSDAELIDSAIDAAKESGNG